MGRHPVPTGELSPSRPVIFADRGCPFAHRVLALLDHLGVASDLREAHAGQLPEELTRWSPSGRMPLLVHGAVTIGESRVMLELLAEEYAFESAYPRALRDRTLQQHAMALMDGTVVPWLTRDEATLNEARLAECLDVFEGVALAPPEPCLLAFHFAPMWLRFQWWRPEGAVTRAIRGRPKLEGWLDGAAKLAAVVRTAPNQAENLADFHAVSALHAAPKR